MGEFGSGFWYKCGIPLFVNINFIPRACAPLVLDDPESVALDADVVLPAAELDASPLSPP